ncbi:MAG TPA: hypothetical protein VHG72_17465 [Polyangia bacterium]|nr:hypothetical protein [Polyangia bacterium]
MRSNGTARGVFALAVSLSSLGCHAGAGARRGPAAPSPAEFTVHERAETGPITALAAKAPILWAAGAPGLRRWDVSTGEWEQIAEGVGGRGLTALAVDDEGAAWVASAAESGRWTPGKAGGWRFEPTGSPGDVTALAARRPVKTRGVWAGGPGGLFRFDGHRWSVVDGLEGAAVSWLALDDDGETAWVGTRGRGLFRAGDKGASPAPGGAAVTADEIVGMAKTANGTRVVVGNVAGDARLYALTLAGTIELQAPIGIHAVALVQKGPEALLIAGPVGRELAYTLRALDQNEAFPSGGLRFLPPLPARTPRWAGVPAGLTLPHAVTAAAVVGTDLYVGSAALGISRAEAGPAPKGLEGSELVGDAERFTVACRARDACLVVTDGPRAWQTDGERYAEARVGEADAAEVLAVAGDSAGATYAVSAEPQFKGVVLTRRPAGQNDWAPIGRVALELPPRTTPKIAFAAISPTGVLWAGLRAASGSGEDVGYGAIEVDLQTGISVQHRPRGPTEKAPLEALPLPADLNGVLFDGGATWFASLSGIFRFQQGQLQSWGESDGLLSELCWGIGQASDGTVWAATSEGIARFDGKSWHPAAGTSLTVHSIASDAAGHLWLATSKGLEAMGVGGNDIDAVSLIVPGEMRDLTRDSYGRLWALSASSIALVAPAPPLPPSAPPSTP